MHSNPILLTFCTLLCYKDLHEHMRRYRIEKLLMPLQEPLKNEYTLMPIAFKSKPSPESYLRHPFLENKSSLVTFRKVYTRKVINRWHLFIRLSLNLELTGFRNHRIKDKTTSQEKKKENFLFIMKKQLSKARSGKSEKAEDGDIILETISLEHEHEHEHEHTKL